MPAARSGAWIPKRSGTSSCWRRARAQVLGELPESGKSQFGHFEAGRPPEPNTGSWVPEARAASPGRVARELRGEVNSANLSASPDSRRVARNLRGITAILEGRIEKPRMKKRTKTQVEP